MMEDAISFEPGSLAWGVGWFLCVALGAAIGFAQREWWFALTGYPESERKPVYAQVLCMGAFLSMLPGFLIWPPILAVEIGWLVHSLFRSWLAHQGLLETLAAEVGPSPPKVSDR